MPESPRVISLSTPTALAAEFAPIIILLSPVVSASPALSLPCGFDQYERPVGLQIVGRPRGEASLLAAGSLFEKASQLLKLVPLDPKKGVVPPLN